jgi:hypothetical protein
MARRGGKAASRKAKQRRAQRPNVAARPATPAPSPVDSSTVDPVVESGPMQSVAAPARESGATPEARERTRRTTRDPRQMVAGPSSLSERAQQEYHYVGRDLRNIGVLVVIMAAILAVAFIAFNVLGIARAG